MATQATPTIPVAEITAQVSTAVSGIVDVIVDILPLLFFIFATIVSLYLVLTLVRRVARGK